VAGWQTIKVRDYGDDWINRLAVLLKTIAKMDEREREATLSFIFGKYQRRITGTGGKPE
jgi:hypothetical protein